MWQLDKNPNFIFNIIHFHWLLIYLLNTIPENEALSVNVVNTNKQYNPISKPSLGVILPSNRFSLMYSNVKSMFVERKCTIEKLFDKFLRVIHALLFDSQRMLLVIIRIKLHL